MLDSLPIDAVLPEITSALRDVPALVLQAPPGAGKTTRVPLALLSEPWAANGKIIILEPRRLAARAAARRMSEMLRESLGDTVGFRVRGETVVGAQTRIEVVTEGVLIRMLLDDPTLHGIAAVILDEFHERSIQADTALALLMQTQSLVRGDLRVIVMSATLDAAPVAKLIGARVVTSVGRSFHVAVHHAPPRADMRIEAAVSLTVQRALREHDGDILVFLPGAPEIHRCMSLLGSNLPEHTLLLPLFGTMAFSEQDSVMRAAPDGIRKIILATSIAESSLTIEGIRVVVDSGLSRVPRFNARSGMSHLATVRVTRASADQRCGRAGRTNNGACYRLWSVEEDAQLLMRARPEILEADLASLALTLAEAGVSNTSNLVWMDAPPAGALAQACELLAQLGAVESSAAVPGSIPCVTPHGSKMALLPAHPRLAHMLVASNPESESGTACAIAALLSERDVLRRQVQPDSDMRTRVALLTGQERGDADRDALRRVNDERRRLAGMMGIPGDTRIDVQQTGKLLARAYPDRVAKRRSGSADRYLLRNGAGATLRDAAAMGSPEFIVVADADIRQPHGAIYLSAPVDEADVFAEAQGMIAYEESVSWDAKAGAVVGRRRELLGAIVLSEKVVRVDDDDVAAEELLRAIQSGDDIALEWAGAAQQLRERLAFLHLHDPTWPDVSDAALMATAHAWLRPHLHGLRKHSEVGNLPLGELLRGMLSWEQRRDLEVLAPPYWTAPTGTEARVEYGEDAPPRVSIRLQEVFGVAHSPMIGGVVPLTFILLSPAGRPIQVTRDLAGFWAGSYAEVRKEMRGRYPKHVWPEDPASAQPTRRAKPRGS